MTEAARTLAAIRARNRRDPRLRIVVTPLAASVTVYCRGCGTKLAHGTNTDDTVAAALTAATGSPCCELFEP